MKLFVLIKCFLIACCLLLVNAVRADTVSLRADTWYPVNGTPGDALPGYMIEIAQKALSAGGHSVDYQTMPWARAITEARSGKVDCIIGAYKEDAPDFVFPEEALGMVGQTFYVKAGDAWRYNGDIQSLDGQRIGIIGDYSYGDEFMAYMESATAKSNIQVINGDNALEQNFKKVLAGRITSTIETEYVAEAAIKNLGLTGQIVPAGQLTAPAPVYIACSPAKPSSKQYAKLLSEGVQKMRASGELKSILAKYGLKDWK